GNEIGDKGVQNIALSLSNCTQLKNLAFSSDNDEKFLKSREIINCKNIKLLNIFINELPQQRKTQIKRLAQKIKRLVKLKID
ncbi:hypothetical protein TTHERM_002653342, partial (macronuclear) [Tetrahymena thermophila SB210]